MRTLVVPDIHQDVPWLNRILKVPHDRLILLGDYFDTRAVEHSGRAGEVAQAVCELLEWPTTTALFGNHDLMYLWPKNYAVRCSGFNSGRIEQVAPFRDKLLAKLNWYIYLSDDDNDSDKHWVLSHAGIHPSLVAADGELFELLNAELKEVRIDLDNGRSHELIGAGKARGGPYNVGGLVWCDWRYEFKNLPGVQQIVGHTIGPEPRPSAEGNNWCIDCNQTTAAIIEDGRLEIVRA